VIEDDGTAISYKVLRRGTPVRSADGEQVGTVRRVEESIRENIFDGIVIDTPRGKRFVDAPEVARITDRVVTLTFDAAEADRHLLQPGSRVAESINRSRSARRVKRLADRVKDAWDRR
jgi:hypothetical protein